MAQPTWTFLRLVNRVLHNMRKPSISDVRSQTLPTVAKDVIEIAREEYQDLCTRQDWHWLRKSAYLQLNAEVTGTATTINGALSVGNPTSWDNVYQGRKIKLANSEEEYILQNDASAITATLDRPFLGESASDVAYTIFDDDYALESDFNRFIIVNKFIASGRIRLVGLQEFRRMQFEARSFGSTAGSDTPLYGTLIHSSAGHEAESQPSAPILLLRPWPVLASSIPYDYIQEPEELTTNDSTFHIPNVDMSALIHKIMIPMFAYIEEDSKVQAAVTLYADKYGEMTGSKTNVDDVMRLQIINRDRVRFSRVGRRRRGGIDFGSFFDRDS